MSSFEPTLAYMTRNTGVHAATFCERYGEETAWITGLQGARVEKTSIRSVYERWWTQPEVASVAALAGHVVHWPLKQRRGDELVRPVLHEADRVVADIGLDTSCLLDQFRRDETPHYLWAILGPAGSCVDAHQDMFGTASWNVLLSGRKKWTLWAAHASPQDDAPYVSFEQQPGQIVWIPEDWWHRVTYDEPSLCLSKNLVLRRTLSIVRKRVGVTEPALSRHLAAVAAVYGCEIERNAVD